ncbi:hypothetical protein [uncultured Rhodoblastus sp.]|uniref:hypothetical protein n=1 Tax=uncultured Rhodoblastus sp. TaxID=543037 RepID=UPI0025D53AA7|nr:hypothetical protein [uncultured Rhodoblastus sp.]
MTQNEMERDLDDMRSYLSVTSYIVERCRHESVEMTKLWVFDKAEKQIASFERMETLSQYKWRGQKIRDGLTITDLPFHNLNEAAAYVCRWC